jgi:uncharacterized membrane protein
VSIVLYVIVGLIVGVGAAADSGAIALLGSLLYFVVLLGILAAVVFSCIQAFMGKIFKLPIIGNMADNWSN